MAYAGYLLKVNGTEFPMKYIAEKSYTVHPDQRIDLDSGRDTTGVLHRAVVSHMPVKIEFNTVPLNSADVAEISRLLNLSRSNAQRKCTVQYYNTETDSYASATCYVPNLDYTIDWIDKANNRVHYSAVRYAFIEH